MNYRVFLFVSSAALLTLVNGLATENDRLTREERDRVGHLYAKVMQDKEVKEARAVHEEAVRHYHEVLRNAMIKRDPKIEPALAKIRINPGLLAEAIWQKRNKDLLKNLHLPVDRLDGEERKLWNRSMDKLHEKEVTKQFGKRLENNYNQQAKLRKSQTRLIRDFKAEARRRLLEIDGKLKPLIEKLELRGPYPKSDKNPDQAKAPVEQVEEAPLNPLDNEEAEFLPPMPMPMPSPEEC